MDIMNFLQKLADSSWFFPTVTFVFGWMARPLKRKDALREKGLPQIYSCVIRRDEDIENIKSLISSSNFCYIGTFIDNMADNDVCIKKIENKNQLCLKKLPNKDIKDFEEKMFFMYIKNSMERNISVKDILNANNGKTVFYNSDIKQFKPGANGCIFTKDVERPTQVNLDIDGTFVSYKITEREGYITPSISKL